MTHYEILGVPPEATADEIKQAFRRRSSQAHPDKGGNSDEMAAINAGYEVLSDPERRAEYDRTGLDMRPGELEQEARGALMQLFKTALDTGGDVLVDVGVMVEEFRRRLLLAQHDAKTKRASLVKRSGKIRARKGENLVQMLIERQIQDIDSALPRMERGLKVNALCAEMLLNYEQLQDAPPAHSKMIYTTLLGQMGSWR